MLDLGGHPRPRRQGRGRRCTELPVLPVGVRLAQPGQHRPQHRCQPRGAARSGARTPGRSTAGSSCASPPPSPAPSKGSPTRARCCPSRTTRGPRAPWTSSSATPSARPFRRRWPSLIGRVRDESPARRIVYHGHDTWGLGRGKHACRHRRRRHHGGRCAGRTRRLPVRTGRQRQHLHRGPPLCAAPRVAHPEDTDRVVQLSEKLLAELGEPNRSKTAQGARSSATAFPWVIVDDAVQQDSAVVHSPAFLVTYPIPEVGMTALRAAGPRTRTRRRPTPEELATACGSGEFDVVVAQLGDRFDAALLAAAKVAGISNYAVGYDNIDVAAATQQRHRGGQHPRCPDRRHCGPGDAAHPRHGPPCRRGRPVRTVRPMDRVESLNCCWARTFRVPPWAWPGSVASRGPPPARRRLRDGRHLLLAPTGRPRPRRDQVRHSPFPHDRSAGQKLVETSDFLSVHVPLADTTRHLIDSGVARGMKPTAMLINTARGPVSTKPPWWRLYATGQSGRGRTRRVRERTATGARSRRNCPMSSCCPHLGSATVQVRNRMAELCAANAIAIASGHLPRTASIPRRGNESRHRARQLQRDLHRPGSRRRDRRRTITATAGRLTTWDTGTPKQPASNNRCWYSTRSPKSSMPSPWRARR